MIAGFDLVYDKWCNNTYENWLWFSYSLLVINVAVLYVRNIKPSNEFHHKIWWSISLKETMYGW